MDQLLYLVSDTHEILKHYFENPITTYVKFVIAIGYMNMI